MRKSITRKSRAEIPFFFRKVIPVSQDERSLCMDCADVALRELKRFKIRQPLFSDQEFNLVDGLASYVVFLRHLASGRIVRCTAIFHVSANMAAYMGHERILSIIERSWMAHDGQRR